MNHLWQIFLLSFLLLPSAGCVKKKPNTISPLKQTAPQDTKSTDDGGHADHTDHGGDGSTDMTADSGGVDHGGHGGSGDDHGGHMGGMSIAGSYAGHLEIPAKNIKIAAEAYLYVKQTSDLEEFPVMSAVLKLHLGGFASSEYTSDHYEAIEYSYEQMTLTFDHPENNLVFSGKVHHVDGKMLLQGAVTAKNSGAQGTLNLMHISADETDGGGTDEPGDEGGTDEPGGDGGSDEPGGDGGTDEPGGDGHEGHSQLTGGGMSLAQDQMPMPAPDLADPVMPKMMGSYRGQCQGQPAIMQIETGRDVIEESEQDDLHSLMPNTRITGRLALKNGGCKDNNYCVVRSYHHGGIDFFSAKLDLRGDTGDDFCALRMGQLDCVISSLPDPMECTLDLDPTAMTPYTRYERLHKVEPTAQERMALPSVVPPVAPTTLSALAGTFNGFLHNERLDTYQAFQLDVTTSVSSINPHNNDTLFMSSLASISFGQGTSEVRYLQKFARRSTYLTPGFVLMSEGSDGFLTVHEWRQGYIRGTWASHSFGKVGIVELVKGRMPTMPMNAVTAGNPMGMYTGVVQGIDWSINTNTLSVAPMESKGTLMFNGSFRDSQGMLPRKLIETGAYDFYTGHIAFVSDSEDERMISGTVTSRGVMQLNWPSPGHFGMMIQAVAKTNSFFPLF